MLRMARKTTLARWRLRARTASFAGVASGLAVGQVVARRRVPAALADGDAVQGGVDLPVAVAVEPTAVADARRCRDGPDVGVHGQVASVAKRRTSPISPISLAAVSEPQPGIASSGPVSGVTSPRDLALEGGDVGAERADALEQLARQACLKAKTIGQQGRQMAGPLGP